MKVVPVKFYIITSDDIKKSKSVIVTVLVNFFKRLILNLSHWNFNAKYG